MRRFIDAIGGATLPSAAVVRGGPPGGRARRAPPSSGKNIMAAKASPKSSSRKDPAASSAKRKLSVAPPAEPPPKALTLEERVQKLEERLIAAGPEFQRAYRDSLDMSWIYHDSALEGSVYTGQELKAAIEDPTQLQTDSSIQPICEEIRRHREALDFIRDFATKKRLPITIDVVKKIYLILHPEEGDIKTVKYRKDIPQHRLYFHEYAPPDKITYKVRQILDWTNDPETRRTRSAVRIAARAHYDLLRVFPFPTDSGKVARLFMNLLLLRNGYPPAIVHSTERQRYYEALKGSSATMTQIVQESIENNLGSVEKLLEMHESKGYTVRV
jgi:Fic family protein